MYLVTLDYVFLTKGGYDQSCIFRNYLFKLLSILSQKAYGASICSAHAAKQAFFTEGRGRESPSAFCVRLMGLISELFEGSCKQL